MNLLMRSLSVNTSTVLRPTRRCHSPEDPGSVGHSCAKQPSSTSIFTSLKAGALNIFVAQLWNLKTNARKQLTTKSNDAPNSELIIPAIPPNLTCASCSDFRTWAWVLEYGHALSPSALSWVCWRNFGDWSDWTHTYVLQM